MFNTTEPSRYPLLRLCARVVVVRVFAWVDMDVGVHTGECGCGCLHEGVLMGVHGWVRVRVLASVGGCVAMVSAGVCLRGCGDERIGCCHG